jgi:hypothetical protein
MSVSRYCYSVPPIGPPGTSRAEVFGTERRPKSRPGANSRKRSALWPGAVPCRAARLRRPQPAGDDPVREVRPASAVKPPERALRPRRRRVESFHPGRPAALRLLHDLIEAHVLALNGCMATIRRFPFSPRARRRRAGSGSTFATIGRSAEPTLPPRCSMLRAIERENIPNDILRVTREYFRPMLSRVTTAFIFPIASRARSSRRCVGATRGASSSNWPTLPRTRAAARRRRRSRRSLWRPSNASTRCSTSSAKSPA